MTVPKLVAENAPECPRTPPPELTACPGASLRCTYGDTPDCASSYECYQHRWYPVSHGSCSAGAPPACPREPGPQQRQDFSLVCVYPGGITCQARSPDREHPCSGVAIALRPSPPQWSCALESLTCEQAARRGGTCEVEGQSCGTTCCGEGFACRGHRWETTLYPCPP